MWSLSQPAETKVSALLARQQGAALSYAQIGASATPATPAGFNLDHNRIGLGRGAAAYAAARAAVARWEMFPRPWTRIAPANAPIEAGTVVAMQAHALGLWWLNACRIVYVVDEAAPVRRWGFAYGTLPAHVERGEERFTVEWRDDDSVWYDLRAFSQPRYWAARVAKPLARRLQRKFVRDSQAAMVAAVARETGSA
ncbi:DUF1990 domain-containing protein [Horticoccus luteus]|uniref:DUF1990 domain-containing protein n=1 Tax=Horticoccus luteus TaxID=2862869 RepID=A0A8F9TVS9_9BACT|nr:DUF1990 domain-containing protein [Horticoccus luteus]QYM79995.1 DUF1990 domain-containing protein [Horticoccus luteus]